MKLFRLPIIAAFLLVYISSYSQGTEKELTIEEFALKVKASPNAQILDVRTTEEFEENHLPGAVSVSLKDSVTFWQKVNTLDKSRPVFVYSINNGRSGVVAKQLKLSGFEEVYKLPGGIAHWLGAGYPVVSKQSNDLRPSELKKIVQENETVLVSIGSKYCGSCKKLAPIVKEIEHQRGKDLKIVTAELYQNGELAKELQIEAVPTLVLYKGTKEVWRNSGWISKAEIESAIDKTAGGL